MTLFPRVAGAVRRRPVLAACWVAACLLLLVQNVRLGRYMADPAADWWLTTRHEFWAKHACLPAYIVAADLLRQGEPNVYDERHYAALVRDAKPALTVQHLAAVAGDPFQYPPPFLLLPAAALRFTNDYLVIRTWWYALETIAFVTVSLLLAAWVGGRTGAGAALLIPVFWLSVPLMQSLQFGQFHLAAILLAVAGMVACERGQPAAGGALLAGAILSKIFPGILLLLLVVQRRWRAVAWTLAFVAAVSLVALLVLGPRPFEAFIGYQLPRLTSGHAFDFAREWPEYRTALLADNLSMAAVVAKLRELGVPGMSEVVGRTALAIYTLGVLAITVAAGRRPIMPDRAVSACTWLALLNLAALQAAGAWADYVTVGSVWLLTYLWADFGRSRATAVFLGLAWVACAVVPGAMPIPVFLPVPAAMILTSAIAFIDVGLNAWVIVRAGLPRRAEACAPSPLVAGG